MNKPIKASLPENSEVELLAAGASFHDAWKIQAALPELDPLDQFLRVVRATPKWVDYLMELRNQVVSLFGLKNLGALSDVDPSKSSSNYLPGERVGIFTLIKKSDQEVLLGDDDKHLKVVVSLYKNVEVNTGNTIVTVSTVVHIKNWAGQLYMMPVVPVHHIIARNMTKTIGNIV